MREQKKMEVDMKRIASEVKLNVKRSAREGLKLALFLIVAGFLAIVSSSMAKAQMINPFGFYNGPTLGQQDYKLALEALQTLLSEKPPIIGGFDTWSNSNSGNRGKFTILELFTSKEMPCRKVNANFFFRSSGFTRSFTLNFCELPSGEWKSVG
jgi:surface antigen